MPFFKHDEPGTDILFVRCEPQIRTVTFHGQPHRLVFPYSLFMLFYSKVDSYYPNYDLNHNQSGSLVRGPGYSLDGLKVAFSPKPFTCDKTDEIYGLPLYNFDQTYAICLYEYAGAGTKDELVKKVIDHYWMSGFRDYRDDFSFWWKTYSKQAPNFFREWAAATAKKDYEYPFRSMLGCPIYPTLWEAVKSYPNLKQEIYR